MCRCPSHLVTFAAQYRTLNRCFPSCFNTFIDSMKWCLNVHLIMFQQRSVSKWKPVQPTEIFTNEGKMVELLRQMLSGPVFGKRVSCIVFNLAHSTSRTMVLIFSTGQVYWTNIHLMQAMWEKYMPRSHPWTLWHSDAPVQKRWEEKEDYVSPALVLSR